MKLFDINGLHIVSGVWLGVLGSMCGTGNVEVRVPGHCRTPGLGDLGHIIAGPTPPGARGVLQGPPLTTITINILSRSEVLMAGRAVVDLVVQHYLPHQGGVLPAVLVILGSHARLLGHSEDAVSSRSSHVGVYPTGCTILPPQASYLLRMAGVGKEDVIYFLAESVD